MMNPYIYKAKVINVVDGDTVDAVIDVGFKMTTVQRLRLLGVDTPEMNDKDINLRVKAIAAKNWLADRILNKDVIVQTKKSDSFGRYLANVFIQTDEITQVLINQELIDKGFSTPYEHK